METVQTINPDSMLTFALLDALPDATSAEAVATLEDYARTGGVIRASVVIDILKRFEWDEAGLRNIFAISALGAVNQARQLRGHLESGKKEAVYKEVAQYVMVSQFAQDILDTSGPTS